MLENVLLGIVSICTFISYFPQIVKCLKTKQAEDLSISSWILWVISSVSYTLYALLCTDSFMLIFETCLELGFCLTILICAILFRKKQNTKRNNKGVEIFYSFYIVKSKSSSIGFLDLTPCELGVNFE